MSNYCQVVCGRISPENNWSIFYPLRVIGPHSVVYFPRPMKSVIIKRSGCFRHLLPGQLTAAYSPARSLLRSEEVSQTSSRRRPAIRKDLQRGGHTRTSLLGCPPPQPGVPVDGVRLGRRRHMHAVGVLRQWELGRLRGTHGR